MVFVYHDPLGPDRIDFEDRLFIQSSFVFQEILILSPTQLQGSHNYNFEII